MSTGAMLTFSGEKRQLSGHQAYTDGDRQFPGVAIIHTIYGLNKNVKDLARRFADVGYVALAVDLFAGHNKAVCMVRFN